MGKAPKIKNETVNAHLMYIIQHFFRTLIQICGLFGTDVVDQFVPVCMKNDVDIPFKIALKSEWSGYAKAGLG